MAALHQIVNFGRASGIQTLRPFPAVACHLMKLVDGATKVDFGEVSRVLMADAAFSSQVLRVANSALFGARYEIKSILQALCVVGVDRLHDLVVTIALKDYVGRGDNLFLDRCWRHNLATALWCEALADHCNIELTKSSPVNAVMSPMFNRSHRSVFCASCGCCGTRPSNR